MSTVNKILPLVVSAGEPAGIGPEIIAATWQHYQHQSASTTAADTHFVVIGDADLLAARGHIPTQSIITLQDNYDFSQALPVLHRPFGNPPLAGQPDPCHAPKVQAAIREAAMLCHRGFARAMITAPIDKTVLQSTDFQFKGHTDYLEWLNQQYTAQQQTAVMMLTAKDSPRNLRCVPVTVHVALKQAIADITPTRITRIVTVFINSLRQQFGLSYPRLAISGLNPHAGENGLMGDEDHTIIAPTVAALNQQYHDHCQLDGPLPADSLFTPTMRQKYDGFVCMYHDQALIPIKTLAFERAVNVTLGLNIIRTSPDHGTAYALAGTNKANPTSMIHAVEQAALLSARPSNNRVPSS